MMVNPQPFVTKQAAWPTWLQIGGRAGKLLLLFPTNLWGYFCGAKRAVSEVGIGLPPLCLIWLAAAAPIVWQTIATDKRRKR